MSVILALAAAIVIASGETDRAADDFILFKNVCMDGAARLPLGEVRITKFESLPTSIKESLARSYFYIGRRLSIEEFLKPSRLINGRYMTIGNGPSRNYLAVETRDRPNVQPVKLYTLFTKSISFEGAVVHFDPKYDISQLQSYRVKPRPNSLLIGNTTGWHQTSSLGYVIAVDRVGDKRVALQTQVTTIPETKEGNRPQ